MLTQKELKELLHYNPDTGVFTWLVSGKNRVKVGHAAGCVNSHGYVKITLQGKSYSAHRLAWLYITGDWPKQQVDHINHDKKDNSWGNMREVTPSQNSRNVRALGRGSSNYKGVSYRNDSGSWRAIIRHGGKNNYLGSFDCEHEAALVYNQAAIKHFGEHAWLNKVYNNFDVLVGEDV